ncbi:17180_t:CDS:2, partial [Racocetra fulgida]
NDLQAAKTEIIKLKQDNQNLEAANSLYAQQIKLIDTKKEKLNNQLSQNKIEHIDLQFCEIKLNNLEQQLINLNQTIK